uniref:Integrin subunit alpha 2b n=1 Tax=Apteryx owenii TaxID=8824 RepID=A0A8B9PXU2_APTOW
MAAARDAAALLCALALVLAPRSAPALDLLHARPAVYEGPPGSYFGFALDFHAAEGRTSVAVGAPRANTSQPGVVQPGAVFLCSWPPGEAPCRPVAVDAEGAWGARVGREDGGGRSHQWLGASVTSWDGKLVACAPLQHWNAIAGVAEAFRTPAGACFVGSGGLQRFARYAPCRDSIMADLYLQSRYGERGAGPFPQDGTLVLGAPGGYYFSGECGLAGGCGRPRHPAVAPPCPPTQVGCPSHPRVPTGSSSPLPPSPHGTPRGHPPHGATPSPTPGSIAPCPSTVPHPGDLLQVASYFGHTVAVADVDGDGRDDVLVGAPLFLEQRADGKRHEVGRVYLYLQRGARPYARPWQTLTGPDAYGRFGSAIASLGDLDQDGYTDVAVGAPFGGDAGSGRVFVFRGQSEGLARTPSQRLESPFPGPAAFGFALRGASDLDGNGYPDLLVGAFGAAKVAVYRGQPVVVAHAQLGVPNGLNPEEQQCAVPGSGARVSCFSISLCVSVSGQRIPKSIHLLADLQLDRLKQKPARRVLLLHGGQSSWGQDLTLVPGAPPLCRNLTAYLRDEAKFKDKLSPIVVSLNLTLAAAQGTAGLELVLYGDTLVQEQTRIVLDCGEDNVCTPDLRLAADTPGTRLLIGAENAVRLRANASNAGEGAFEAELWVQLPPGTHYQKAASDIQVGARGGGGSLRAPLSCPGPPCLPPPCCPRRGRRWRAAGAWRTTASRWNTSTRYPAAPTSPPPPHPSRCPPSPCHLARVPQLHNEGPSTVSGVTLRLAVPSRLQGSLLLYLLELGTEGGMNCTEPPGLNSKQVGGQWGGWGGTPAGCSLAGTQG